MTKAPTALSIYAGLTIPERILLFCLASTQRIRDSEAVAPVLWDSDVAACMTVMRVELDKS